MFKARPTIETNCNLTETQQSIEIINKPKQLVSSPRYAFWGEQDYKNSNKSLHTSDHKNMKSNADNPNNLINNEIEVTNQSDDRQPDYSEYKIKYEILK